MLTECCPRAECLELCSQVRRLNVIPGRCEISGHLRRLGKANQAIGHVIQISEPKGLNSGQAASGRGRGRNNLLG